MRFTFASFAVVALATQTVVGSNWLGTKPAYNKWHETELERWLSDHDIPYPAPSDRKDLEDLVKNNWDSYVSKPYNSWDTQRLTNYITSQGKEVKKGTEKNKDSLLSQVQGYWHETENQASDSYNSVQDWIFDTWTESQLKSFLDHNGIPNPSPRTRDSLLSTARSNYQSAANKVGQTSAYPGNWLYDSWSESDLKAWLDERGIPAPQPSSRDKLIASLRRNSRTASNSAASQASSASASARSATQSLSDQLINSWSDTDLKAWFDKNGINVPQGSKSNELKALARKHSAQLSGNNVQSSASSAYGAASTSAGNYYAQATADAYGFGRQYYDYFLNQFGLASKEAKASLSSASSVASVSASKSASQASKSVSSASKNPNNAASQASASASSASSLASKSASSAAKQASKSTQSVKNEL
ncbi:hypothetical protein LTR09_009357 [Extremus antarcticus]|uniref:Stress response protein ish1 n=1 Tax=Extremus antarcticus TaxID=702011 RepID=A0AAJ0D917_9PEZI|nr:hypothetical protein LTR09_009357 [Extremus antarcticus]